MTTSAGREVVARAVAVGAMTGVAVGAAIGTVDWPLVGTVVLAFYGLPSGLGVGLTWGVVLAGSRRVGLSVRSARRVGVLTAAGVTALLAEGTGWFGPGRAAAVVGFAAVIALLVSRPVVCGPRPGEVELIGRYALRGVAVTVAVGAVVGLVVGLRVYPPTSPFALLEGAFFGGVLGAVPSVLVGVGRVLIGRRR